MWFTCKEKNGCVCWVCSETSYVHKRHLTNRTESAWTEQCPMKTIDIEIGFVSRRQTNKIGMASLRNLEVKFSIVHCFLSLLLLPLRWARKYFPLRLSIRFSIRLQQKMALLELIRTLLSGLMLNYVLLISSKFFLKTE